MAINPPPIETHWKGWRFRSRLEARWAIFLTELGIEFWYEPDAFKLRNGQNYLPDFLLPRVVVRLYTTIRQLTCSGSSRPRCRNRSGLLAGRPNLPATASTHWAGDVKINNRTPELYFYEWSVARWRASTTRAALDSAGRSVYREILDLIKHHFQQDKHDENAFRHKEADVVRRNFFATIRDQKKNAKKGGHAKANRLRKMSSDSRENSCLITEQNITEAVQNTTEPIPPTRKLATETYDPLPGYRRSRLTYAHPSARTQAAGRAKQDSGEMLETGRAFFVVFRRAILHTGDSGFSRRRGACCISPCGPRAGALNIGPPQALKGGRLKDRIPELTFYEWSILRWATSDTRDALDATGIGIYRELIDRCYAKGSIPKSRSSQARIAKCTTEQLEHYWPILKENFQAHKKDPEKLTNSFADAYRSDYFRYLKAQKRKGKKGGIANASNIKRVGSSGLAVAEPLLKPNTIRDETIRDETIRDESTRKLATETYDPLPGYRRFTKAYPGLVVETDCQLWISLIESQSEEDELFANLELWRKSEQWADKKFIPYASNFLSKRLHKTRPPEMRQTAPERVRKLM